MTAPVSPVGPLLQAFFTQHLLSHKRASPQTIASYRDSFRLLLQFVRETRGIAPTALRVPDLDVPVLLAFLEHLERERHNSVRSRNARLAAIRSFFRFVALREPIHVGLCARVLAIPVKRADRALVKALTRMEIEALLAAPDLTEWRGRLVALDDRRARMLARQLDLPMVGLAGLLIRAKKAGVLPAVKPYLEAARSRGFYLHPDTYAQALLLGGEQ